jgi:transglutaminase-like putative cysteine protease
MPVYSIKHTTTYQYHQYVSLCHNLAMLSPRDTLTQRCTSSYLHISPVPDVLDTHIDFFGNKVFYFVIEQEHNKLAVTAHSVVEKLTALDAVPVHLIAWEEVKALMAKSAGGFVDEKQFTMATGVTYPSEEIRAYAMESFPAHRPLYEAVFHLMQRIYRDFSFVHGFTTVSTPLSVVMRERKGVCQDFAHLGLACLHAMGLPARYVSGYLETLPPPGKEKLTGVDASHAWFSVFIPYMGWVDFDPTNNKIPNEQYITVAWGRDYFDVVPLKGVIMSSSHHKLKVSVDVKRLL